MSQTLSREAHRKLENKVTVILQNSWPASEISQWVGALPGKAQAVACAILRRRHPRPASLGLPAIDGGAAKAVRQPAAPAQRRASVPVLTADGRPLGRQYIPDGAVAVNIGADGTIRHAQTARTLWIAPGSATDRANPGSAQQINPTYQPAMHYVVADYRQHVEAGE
ncbi:MAG: hypothetical protein ACRC8Q_03730 [Aeromonas sp.]